MPVPASTGVHALSNKPDPRLSGLFLKTLGKGDYMISCLTHFRGWQFLQLFEFFIISNLSLSHSKEEHKLLK